MVNTGIYKITCLITNKVYIGSAVWFDHRWRVHKSDLRLNQHDNKYLQRAYNKHEMTNFKFEIIEHCKKNELLTKEQFWIDWLSTGNPEFGFNLSPVAGSRLGTKHTEKFKKKQSERYKGTKRNPEAVARTALANTGKKRSQEIKDRMSLAQRKSHKKMMDNSTRKLELKREVKGIINYE